MTFTIANNLMITQFPNRLAASKFIIFISVSCTIENMSEFSPRNVYWTDTAKSAILVARHDGNYKKTLLMENGFKPTAILVDPEVGLVFCFL